MLIWMLVGAALAGGTDASAYPEADEPGAVFPVRAWDVEHLDLTVDIDIDEGVVRGRTVHRLAPLPRPSSRVRLHQVGLDIQGVQVDGEDASFELGEAWVEIPVEPGEAHEVAIAYTARPELGMHFRRAGHDGAVSDEVWTQGENEDHRYWFPSWDHPTDRFTLSTTVTVDSDLTVVANGPLQDKQEGEDGRTTWSFALEQPIVNYLVVIAAGHYRLTTQTSARVPVHTYVRSDLPESASTEGVGRAAQMLPWFESVLRESYPYPDYTQVAVQGFMYGGMENASATVLADRLLVDDPWDDPRRAESVVAHELAHQWFGDHLTCYGWRELWLNEGFATYWTNRWMEHAHGEAYGAWRWFRRRSSTIRQPHPMSLRAWGARDGDPDSHNVYGRGSGVLRMFEVHLGRETFDAGIALYTQRNAGRLVETADLRRALEDVSGESLGWVFDQWVHRPGAPSFTVAHDWDGEDGQLVVTIEQDTAQGMWKAPVQVEVGTDDGPVRRTIWVDGGTSRLVLDLEAPPRWVLADPDYGVVATWDQQQDPDQWRAALAGSATWTGRLQALEALGTPDGEEASSKAVAAMLQDPELDRSIRAHAASVLGRRQDAAAVEALRSGLILEEPIVREGVVAALGSLPPEPDLVDRLDTILRRDPDARVRAAALRALTQLDADAGVKEARRQAGRGEAPVRRAAFEVLGDHGRAKDARDLLDGLDTRGSRGVRQSAAYALWKLVERNSGNADLQARASRAAEQMLSSDDVRVRSLAIRLLGGIGDDAAAARLTTFAAEATHRDQREAALDAAKQIRGRSGGPGRRASPPTPDDLERIRQRLEALQRKVEDLEQRP